MAKIQIKYEKAYPFRIIFQITNETCTKKNYRYMIE